MASLKTLLPIVLSLAATTTAISCPQNWLPDTFGGDSKCCYGNMLVEDTDAYCCVYDMTPHTRETLPTSSSSVPSTTIDWSSAGSCFAKIPFSASDYSSQVSAASARITATTTGPSTNKATPTSTSSGSSSTTSSGSSSSASSGSGTPTTNAAMPVATAEGMVLRGAAVAVALFAL